MPNTIIGTFGFDNADQLTSISYMHGATTVGTLGYGYDLGGRRTSMTGTLAGFVPPTAVPSLTYDGTNRLTSWGGKAISYDANGNITNFGSATYTWNARNQLTATSGGGAAFSYDALGRRVSAVVSGVTTPYLYDGQNPAMISTNQMLAGAGLDEIYAQINSSGTTSYLRDGLNSTVALTNSSGATTASYSYSPYGDSVGIGTSTTPLQYTGREDDGATGLYFYRARYYSPQLGRFISEDPIGLAGGTNYYAYALGDPVVNNDPNGEFVPLIVILPVIGGLVGGISDVLTATSCQNKWAAFGRGFVSGATGTLVGLGVTALTGNPWLAGAAAGEISSISDQALAGESLDPIKVAASTGLGAVGGKLLSRAFPTVGRLPSMTLPRTLQNTGLNSQRLMIQESGTDALGGGGQYLLNAIQSPAGEGCGCK